MNKIIVMNGPENPVWWRMKMDMELMTKALEAILYGNAEWVSLRREYIKDTWLSRSTDLVLWVHPLVHMYQAFTEGMTKPGEIVAMLAWIDSTFWREGARGIRGRPGG